MDNNPYTPYIDLSRGRRAENNATQWYNTTIVSRAPDYFNSSGDAVGQGVIVTDILNQMDGHGYRFRWNDANETATLNEDIVTQSFYYVLHNDDQRRILIDREIATPAEASRWRRENPLTDILTDMTPQEMDVWANNPNNLDPAITTRVADNIRQNLHDFIRGNDDIRRGIVIDIVSLDERRRTVVSSNLRTQARRNRRRTNNQEGHYDDDREEDQSGNDNGEEENNDGNDNNGQQEQEGGNGNRNEGNNDEDGGNDGNGIDEEEDQSGNANSNEENNDEEGDNDGNDTNGEEDQEGGNDNGSEGNNDGGDGNDSNEEEDQDGGNDNSSEGNNDEGDDSDEEEDHSGIKTKMKGLIDYEEKIKSQRKQEVTSDILELKSGIEEMESFKLEIESFKLEIESLEQEERISRMQEMNSRMQEINSRREEMDSQSEEMSSCMQEINSRMQEVYSFIQEMNSSEQETDTSSVVKEMDSLWEEMEILPMGSLRQKKISHTKIEIDDMEFHIQSHEMISRKLEEESDMLAIIPQYATKKVSEKKKS